MQNIFSSLKLIFVIVYYFQTWNKKEHNIITSRAISSLIAPMYIETAYINGLLLFWELSMILSPNK